jgi:hypothetical protein
MADEVKKIDDGGPAYPCHTDQVQIDRTNNRVIPVLHGGMSLRDYFAAAAMQGMLASGGTYDSWAALVRDAYAVADAMIAARKKPH